MVKTIHEVRDPIHTFIHYGPFERRIIDSVPVQRLRHIHQLALTYLVYPGASHKRFEHSLGVMELAGRVFDVITSPDALKASGEHVRETLPELSDESTRRYWRQVLRLAALLHDVGHLPFSHAAESQLLPNGWNHERLSRAVISDPMMQRLCEDIRPTPIPEDIIKLAIGPREAKDLKFSPWEGILYEIIGGDAFGVDRMDYLLRDSHHTGVAYGRFDHYRLIDSLRILPPPPTGTDSELGEPVLGVEIGGLQSAEALLMARYFMYSQVYFHRVRLIYNIHLQDFLSAWLPEGRFATDVPRHLERTDNEVLAAMYLAAREPGYPGHDPARRIARREHFRILHQSGGGADDPLLTVGNDVFQAARDEFGADALKHSHYDDAKDKVTDFPIRDHNGDIVPARSVSQMLSQLPAVRVDCIFVDPAIRNKADQWLKSYRRQHQGERN